MVASIFLSVFDILSILVYLDLWIVNRYGVHIFTPIMKYVDKSRIKKYQNSYY